MSATSPRFVLVPPLVALLSLGIAGCGETEIPVSDPSAPEVFMFVGGFGNLIQLKSGGSQVSKVMTNPVDLGIVGVARDLQSGIKRVKVFGSATVYCKQGYIGMTKKATYINKDEDTGSPPIGSLVPASRLTWTTVETNKYYVDPQNPHRSPYCPPGFEFKEFYGGFVVVGENYKGQVAATPWFKFSYKPGGAESAGDEGDAEMMPGTEGLDLSLRLAIAGDVGAAEEVFFNTIDDLPPDLPDHPEYVELYDILQSPEGANWFFSSMLGAIEETAPQDVEENYFRVDSRW